MHTAASAINFSPSPAWFFRFWLPRSTTKLFPFSSSWLLLAQFGLEGTPLAHGSFTLGVLDVTRRVEIITKNRAPLAFEFFQHPQAALVQRRSAGLHIGRRVKTVIECPAVPLVTSAISLETIASTLFADALLVATLALEWHSHFVPRQLAPGA